MPTENITEMLRRAAELHGDKSIVYPSVQGERRRTYSETYDEALQVLGAMQNEGLKARDIVVLALDDPHECVPFI